MSLLKNTITDYWQVNLRRKRFEIFENLIRKLNKPVSILDVGGTISYWEQIGIDNKNDLSITLLNYEICKEKVANIKSVVGDARNLSMFRDNQFDIVYSNSVIEHVGDFIDQKLMADEIQRVGKRYFLQTPSFWFPVEPHYRSIYFQLYPIWLKSIMLQYVGVGRVKKIANKSKAMEEAQRIRLLTLKQLKLLFPEAHYKKERFMGFTKSYLVLRGFDQYIRNEL